MIKAGYINIELTCLRDANRMAIVNSSTPSNEQIMRLSGDFDSMPAGIALAGLWSATDIKTNTYQQVIDVFAKWTSGVYYSPVFN